MDSAELAVKRKRGRPQAPPVEIESAADEEERKRLNRLVRSRKTAAEWRDRQRKQQQVMQDQLDRLRQESADLHRLLQTYTAQEGVIEQLRKQLEVAQQEMQGLHDDNRSLRQLLSDESGVTPATTSAPQPSHDSIDHAQVSTLAGVGVVGKGAVVVSNLDSACNFQTTVNQGSSPREGSLHVLAGSYAFEADFAELHGLDQGDALGNSSRTAASLLSNDTLPPLSGTFPAAGLHNASMSADNISSVAMADRVLTLPLPSWTVTPEAGTGATPCALLSPHEQMLKQDMSNASLAIGVPVGLPRGWDVQNDDFDVLSDLPDLRLPGCLLVSARPNAWGSVC